MLNSCVQVKNTLNCESNGALHRSFLVSKRHSCHMKNAWRRCSVTRRYRPRPYPRPCMGGELAVDGRREKQLGVRGDCVVLYLLISPYISLYLPISPYISLYLPISPYISLYLLISPYISLYLLPLIRTAIDWGFVVRARDAWRKYNDRVRGAR